MRIVLSPDNGSNVLSGRESGEIDRKSFGLDFLDEQFIGGSDMAVHVIIPQEVYSVNSSYFLGLFGPSVRALGEKEFNRRYLFECTDVIRKQCVEPGIRSALKTSHVRP
jgi:hypothetical protein